MINVGCNETTHRSSYKQGKIGLPYLAASVLVGLSCATSAQATSVKKIGEVRDLGQNYIANYASEDFSGWGNIDYNGDLLDNWATQRWASITSGVYWPSIGKGVSARSSGYPKLVDTVSGERWASYTLKISGDQSFVKGQHQTGITMWLDDTDPVTWPYTNEINIWNTPVNLTGDSNWTYIGIYNADGSDYKAYKFSSTTTPGITTWVFLRQNRKYDVSLDMRAVLTWLRERGLPNQYWLQTTLAGEGYPGSSGNILFRKIVLPTP